jgi:hypothetical protein
VGGITGSFSGEIAQSAWLKKSRRKSEKRRVIKNPIEAMGQLKKKQP